MAVSGPCAPPTPCRAACVPLKLPPRAHAASRQLCSLVKHSGPNGKLSFAHGLGGRGGAPAEHHLVGGEPADPAARDSLRHRALRARRPRRAPHRRRRGGLAGRARAVERSRVSDYLGKGLLAPVFRDLLDEDPPARFEIVTTHSRAGVRLVAGGEVDLAVVTGQETPRGLEDRHLFDQPFVWVGPRRRRERAPLTERLRREPVLRLAAESRGRALLDQYLADERIRPVSTIDVPSVSLLLAYVSGGLGVGLVPALALSEAPRDRVVSAPANLPALPVALVWRRR